MARGQQARQAKADFAAELFFVALSAKHLPELTVAELEWEVFLRSWQRDPSAWPGYPQAPGDPTMPDGRYWDRGAARVRELLGTGGLEDLLSMTSSRSHLARAGALADLATFALESPREMVADLPLTRAGGG